MKEPQKSFHQATLKVGRAYHHIADVTREASAYIEKDPFELSVKHDRQAGILLSMDLREPIPNNVILGTGDAIHNLKAALDYVWTGIHRAATGAVVRREYFPIGNTRNDVIARITEPSVEVAFPNIKNFLGDRIRPYCDEATGGNPAFRAINHLDRWDKHNLLIPAISDVGDGHFTVMGLPTGTITFKGNQIYSDQSILLLQCLVPIREPLRIEQYAKPTIEIVIGKGQPLAHEPLIPSLKNLAQTVLDTVEAFTSEYG